MLDDIFVALESPPLQINQNITSPQAPATASLLETTTSFRRAIGETTYILLGKGTCPVFETNSRCTSMYLREKPGRRHPEEQPAQMHKWQKLQTIPHLASLEAMLGQAVTASYVTIPDSRRGPRQSITSMTCRIPAFVI